MKKTVMLAAPLLVLAYYGTTQVTTAQGQCEVRTPPANCQAASRITINNQSKNVSPPNVCLGAGKTITVNVTPNGTTARMEGKSGGWPSGNGPSWQLQAPGTSGAYDYNVYFEDGTCLDPRITVTSD